MKESEKIKQKIKFLVSASKPLGLSIDINEVLVKAHLKDKKK